MSFLKSKPAKSVSENTNNSLIKSTYGGQMGEGTGANNFLAQLLGVSSGISGALDPSGGGAAAPGSAQAGYNNYLQNAGYAPAMRQLSQNVTGQQAASGLLNSGATAKALQDRGNDLNGQYFNNYLQQLSGLSGLGLQAGGTVANTGQKSTSVGGSPSMFDQISGAIGKTASLVGNLAPIFSDRRLKADIVKEGEFPDGLGVYSFRYSGEAERHRGVMADEVEKIRPWARGPDKAGYATVDYGAL